MDTLAETELTIAELTIEDGTPRSLAFDDICFSKKDGVSESHYNFLVGNRLPQRFKGLSKTEFCIAETGFGCGLNFLLTVGLWRQQAPVTAKLHYISGEKHPIATNTLAELYNKLLPEQLADVKARLLANYPPPIRGCYSLAVDDSITLTLLFDDAVSGFREQNFTADAWFLDGFAPAKNADLWSPELFAQMAEHSKKGTTFATFTAASAVRRGLFDAGFAVQKTKGFGHKRERLLGTMP